MDTVQPFVRRFDCDTLVIGAGIAGLAAAWTLQQQGRQVRVLEATELVGGRMRTRSLEGGVVDTGAQFLSAGYQVLPALAAACGLTIAPVPGQRNAVRHAGHWRAMRHDSSADAWRSGLLGPLDFMRLGLLYARHRHALSRRSLSDYSDWAAHDDEDSQAWVQRQAGTAALERVVEPLLEGLYFQQPATTSKALVLMAMAFGWQGHANTALAGGMATLPAALAARLPVTCGVRVDSVQAFDDHVEVHAGEQCFHARQVICATTAPQAASIWPAAPPLEQRLMATDYSCTVHLALALGPGWTLPPALQGVYGALVPRTERHRVAAVGIENHKAADRAPSGTLVNLMLSDAAARELLSCRDAELTALLRDEIEALLPGAMQALQGSLCTRWSHAEPRSPIGRARDVAAYRQPGRARPRVLLAGDYLGAPWTDGAAESGLWAAAQVLAGWPDGGSGSQRVPSP